jgi:hypothetical protein
MSYPVYLVSSVGAPRDHHKLFIEKSKNGYGSTFQVTGNIQEGMEYQCNLYERPEDSVTFIEKSYIGTVDEGSLGRISNVLENIPPPSKQFDGAKRINPTEPLRRCQEWTNEAIQALKDEGILGE